MAGTPSLVIETDGTNHSFPDIFQYVTVICRSNADGLISNDQTLHYCEQDTAIDAAFIRMAVGDDDATWTLEKCTDGTAVASGTALSSALSYPLSANNTTKTFTLVTTENIVPAGSAITLKIGGTSTATMIVVTMRIRTRIG